MNNRPFPELSEADFGLLIACATPRLLTPEILVVLQLDASQRARAQSLFGKAPYGVRAPDSEALLILEPTIRHQCTTYFEENAPSQFEALLRATIEHYLGRGKGQSTLPLDRRDEELAHVLEVLCTSCMGMRSAMLDDVLHDYQPGPNLPTSRRVHHYFRAFPIEATHGKHAAIAHLEAVVHEWPDDRIKARAYNSLGFFLSQVNRFDAAQAALNQCFALCAALGEATQDTYPKALTNMGIVYQRLGKYTEARAWTQRRLTLARQDGDWVGTEIALHNLAYAEHRLGEWTLAEEHYGESLAICRLLNDPQSEAQTLLNLGEIHFLQGDFTTAARYLDDALAIFLRAESRNIYEAVDVLANIGLLHFVQGEHAAAAEAYQTALTYLAESKGERTLLESQLHFQIGNLCQANNDAQGAYQHYKNALEIYEQVRAGEQTEDTRISIMGIGQRMYQTMVLHCVEQGDFESAFTYVEQAKARSFLDMLILQNFETSRHSMNTLSITPSVASIRRTLPPHTVLLEFYSTGEMGPDTAMLERLPARSQFLRDYLQAPQRLLLFAISPTSLRVDTINVSMERIAAQFFDRTQGRLLGIAHDNRPLRDMVRWESLATHLFQPLAANLQDCRHIVFVPHGLLHLLPLPVMLSTQLPDITCSFAPSASILYMIRTARKDVPHQRSCLAIGFNKDGLLLSEWEAEHIAQHMCGSWIIGGNATVANVGAELPNSRAIHFSCHGFFNRQHPMRSGLMLADGELTALDILSHYELNAEIVTLAACDTALSELAYGDDPLGLTRALIGAGARAILTSLWSIHEIPTTLLIEEFYRHWQQGRGAVEALSAAQRYLRQLDMDELRAKLDEWHVPEAVTTRQLAAFTARLPGPHPFDHPYYWGAFLLVGNPV